MKKKLYFLASVLVPLLFIALFLKYEVKQRKEQANQKLGSQLFEICTRGAGKAEQSNLSPKTVQNVCACFATTVVRHQNIQVAQLFNDADLVTAILKDCNRRFPTR